MIFSDKTNYIAFLQVFLGQILTTNYGVATFTFAFHFATWICLLVGQKALYMPNNTEFISPSLVVPVQIGQRRALDIDVLFPSFFSSFLKIPNSVWVNRNVLFLKGLETILLKSFFWVTGGSG